MIPFSTVSSFFYFSLLLTLKQIQKHFLWDNKKEKIKQNTLRNGYKDDFLKSVDIAHKRASLKCHWVER